jgi:hypothetical protein
MQTAIASFSPKQLQLVHRIDGGRSVRELGFPGFELVEELIALGRVAEGDRQFPAFQGHHDRGPVLPCVADRAEDILPH